MVGNVCGLSKLRLIILTAKKTSFQTFIYMRMFSVYVQILSDLLHTLFLMSCTHLLLVLSLAVGSAVTVEVQRPRGVPLSSKRTGRTPAFQGKVDKAGSERH